MIQKRVHYLSLASVVSSFAVVMLHTNGCFWVFSKERYWITANIIESIMYFAVPIFFMVSGATLIDYRDRYTTKQYMVKRIHKTVFPLFVWSVIGILYLALTDRWFIQFNIESVKSCITDIVNLNVLSIYWFFGALFSVYLCIPLFACVQKPLRIKIFTYIVIVTFIFNYMLPFITNIFQLGYVSKVKVPIGNDYLIYVLLGYILHKVQLDKKQKGFIYSLAVIGLGMHIIGTQYLSFANGQIVQTYKGYLNVPCILYSVGIFVLFKQIGESIQNQKLIFILEKISSYTFSVYLLHWFVMDIMVRVFTINTFSIVYRMGAPIIIFVICMGITCIIRKIPILRKMLP